MSTPLIVSVDDSSLIRRAITGIFRPFECTLLQAENGALGLDLIRECQPDLVILDCDMPVMGGIEMLELLRQDPLVSRTNVIMLSANVAPQTFGRVARLGVRDFIRKPPDGPVLLARVARLVTLHPRKSAEQEPGTHD
jgi:CheY-like chemotaxis protein